MAFCTECGGEGEKNGCPACFKKKIKKKRTQRDKDLEIIGRERDKERHKFLSKLRTGLHNFNMDSTGSKEVDETIEDEIGEI